MRRVWLTVATLGVGLAVARPAGADAWHPLEAYRIESGRIAPWARPGTRIDPAYQGKEVRFQGTRVVAPRPLACEGAKYEWLFGAPEGLFEGNLPAPAAKAAIALGLGSGLIPTLRVSCTNAGFDFHRTGTGDLLLGLDNVVWTLRPVAAAAAPSEIVQELLVTHFTHDMGFTRRSVAQKRGFLSTGLRTRIAGYFAVPQPPGEVPEIDGDPFTDSQDYPNGFTLGAERSTSQGTVVPVFFTDVDSKRRVDYVLVREGTRWVVDDMVDERGQSLRKLLVPPRPATAPRRGR